MKRSWYNSTNMDNKKHTGFTIVELLIVIVVIGILAAITVVAFNGIQDRAKNAQMNSGMSQYIKALAIYRVDNGTYPAGSIACFNGTIDCHSSAVQASSTALLNAMKKYIPGAPLDLPYKALLTYGNTSDYANGGTYLGYYVLYYPNASAKCEAIADARYLNDIGSSSNGVQCRLALPAV